MSIFSKVGNALSGAGSLFQTAVMAAAVIYAPELLGVFGVEATATAVFAARFGAAVLVSRLFAPNVPATQQNNVRVQVPPDPTAGIPIVYGTAYTSGRFVDAALTNDQQSMYYVMVISCISPNGQFTYDTTKFYYQDQLITFDGTDQTKVVSLTDAQGNVSTSISGNLYIWLYTSTASGTITPINSSSQPSAVMTNAAGLPSGQEWASSNRQMNGTAFAIVKLVYNTSGASTTSLQPITFHVTHALNGTGVAKPGDVWYDYITNPVYGGAIDSSFVDSASATALNTYSDQTISYTDYNGSTQTQPRYRFNGVLDTGQTILTNLDIMMTCCDSWQAYNASTGLWSVVMNKAITPTFAFDDTNIIGSITVSATDITQQPNQVEAKFNDSTNRDQPGYVNIALQTLNPSLLYPNEPVNKFSISYDLLNDNVTTQYLATRIIEQNRLDLIVNFSTTYAGIQVNAGDVVTVTNSTYGWTNKQFRVVQVKESALPDGTLGASFQLSAYDSAVYTISNLQQYHPTPNSGLAAVGYFSALSAPTVTGFPSASIPSFNVSVAVPTVGRVTFGNLYYTTTATPSASDWKLLDTATSAGNIPVANGSTYVFAAEVLPAGTYYFAYLVGNDISQTAISPISSAFVWNPVGMSGASGASGYSGFSGFSGSGSTGPRTATGFLYYATSTVSSPGTPSASSYNFTTGNFGSITSGWSSTFTAPDPSTNPSSQVGSHFWAAYYSVAESTYGGSQTITITSPFNWQNLNGLVTFTNTSTNSGVTFINGGNIQANSLLVDSIKNNTAGTFNTYGTFGLGTGASLGAYQGAGVFNSVSSSLYGLLVGNTAGFNALGAGTTSTNSSGAAVVGVGAGNSTFSTWKNIGAIGVGDSGGLFQTGGASNLGTPSADIRLAYYNGGTSYAFYIYSGASYPFTAGHDAMQLLTEAIPEVGDIMIDVQVLAAHTINDTITQMTVSTTANQNGAIGVFTGVTGTNFVPAAMAQYVEAPDGTFTQIEFMPEYANVYSTYRCIGVNAIGEGQINVCGEGGDISVGDFIVTSNMAGKGMKQADDVFHSYTLAKARENVTFSSPTEVKQIACIYMGG
jgi:hypothetical protein